MKRIATALILLAMLAGSLAHAQAYDMDAAVDKCGQLTQELNLAEEQRMSLEARILNAKNETEMRLATADRDAVVAMISEINAEIDANAACQ